MRIRALLSLTINKTRSKDGHFAVDIQYPYKPTYASICLSAHPPILALEIGIHRIAFHAPNCIVFLLMCRGGKTHQKTIHEGNLLSFGPSQYARPVGTSVTVSNLFSNLPVRQKTMQGSVNKQLKRILSVRTMRMRLCTMWWRFMYCVLCHRVFVNL